MKSKEQGGRRGNELPKSEAGRLGVNAGSEHSFDRVGVRIATLGCHKNQSTQVSENSATVVERLKASLEAASAHNPGDAELLRLIGVPRRTAEPLSRILGMSSETPLTEVRAALREGGEGPWRQALGDLGPTYRTVWSIIEAEGASREGMES